MSTKYTYILFLFAVVLFGYVIWDNKERQITVNSIGKLKAIPISNAGAVNKLILSTNGTKIVLARNNDEIWEITEPIQDRADSNIVTKILETITTLKKFEIKEDDTQGKDMGIDDGAVSLEIFQNNEYTGKVTFGDETGLSGTVYANWSSDKVNDSFFCWADARNEIDISFDKLRDPQLVKSLIEEIQEIEVSDET